MVRRVVLAEVHVRPCTEAKALRGCLKACGPKHVHTPLLVSAQDGHGVCVCAVCVCVCACMRACVHACRWTHTHTHAHAGVRTRTGRRSRKNWCHRLRLTLRWQRARRRYGQRRRPRLGGSWVAATCCGGGAVIAAVEALRKGPALCARRLLRIVLTDLPE